MTRGQGLIVKRGGDLSLPGEALAGILADVIEKGVPFRFRAKGFSMSPFLKDGDVLTVSPLGGLEPRTGDIIAFRHPGTGLLAVHRVVRKSSGTLVPRGDNSPEADGPLSSGTVLGIVTAVERSGKPLRLGSKASRSALALFSRSGLLAPLLRWIRGFLWREARGE